MAVSSPEMEKEISRLLIKYHWLRKLHLSSDIYALMLREAMHSAIDNHEGWMESVEGEKWGDCEQ